MIQSKHPKLDGDHSTPLNREQISDIFARACKNNEYFGNDGWYELHTPTIRKEISELIQQSLKAFADEVEREVIGKDISEGTAWDRDDFNNRRAINITLKEQRKNLKDTLNKWISEED